MLHPSVCTAPSSNSFMLLSGEVHPECAMGLCTREALLIPLYPVFFFFLYYLSLYYIPYNYHSPFVVCPSALDCKLKDGEILALLFTDTSNRASHPKDIHKQLFVK